jgi:CRISPR/Cas system CSM-associated protein Csm3 (group 7 of RAMP superfamily)
MPATDPEAKSYKFVPLDPGGKKTSSEVNGHEKWTDLSGAITITIKALTPLHIASGMTVAAADLREREDIAWPNNFTEPLALEHYRSGGKRVIPATSLKGSIRSVVEAISRSCVSKSKGVREDARGNRRDRSPFEKSRECRAKIGEPLKLCPACRLFGAMGFEGRVRFSDAPQSVGGGLIAFRPAPNQPNRDFSRDHPIHSDKYYQTEGGNSGQIIGRKLYLHYGQPEDQRVKYEPIEVCARDSVFTFKVEFESLKNDELGLLITALGQGDGVKAFKIGGSKPFGYGTVEVTNCSGTVWNEASRKERCLSWDENSVESQDWVKLSQSAIAAAQANGLVLARQLNELKAIFNPQAQYSAEDVARWRKGGDKYE